MVSFRTTFLVLMVSGLLVSELRFGWVERIAGEYLHAVNHWRPESGRVWDYGKHKTAAIKTLEEIARVRLSSQQEARRANSIGTLINGLAEDQGMMISASHFLELYGKLSPLYAGDLISPYELLNFASSGEWERSYFEKVGGQDVGVYLLNHENMVLADFIISAKRLKEMDSAGTSHITSLESMDQFSGRIYSASDFFQAALKLPDDVRKAVIPEPLNLIRINGRILKASISDEVKNGYIELGFEMEAGDARRVVVVPGQEWAVWQLRKRLENEGLRSRNRMDDTEDDRQIN